MFPTFSFDMLLTEYLWRINFLFSSFFLRRVCRSCAYKAANNLVLIQTRDCKDICQTTKNYLRKKKKIKFSRKICLDMLTFSLRLYQTLYRFAKKSKFLRKLKWINLKLCTFYLCWNVNKEIDKIFERSISILTKSWIVLKA